MIKKSKNYLYHTNGVEVNFTSEPEEIKQPRTISYFNLFIGKPQSGKTTEALAIGEQRHKDGAREPLLHICNYEESLNSLFETVVNVDKQLVITKTKLFELLTDPQQRPGTIILDEINLMSTSTLKSLQPILDNTSKEFEFKNKVWIKNPNLVWIGTMNFNDVGISPLPNALLARATISFFDGSDITIVDPRYKGFERIFNKLELDDLANITQFRLLDAATEAERISHVISLLILVHGDDYKLTNDIIFDINNVFSKAD